MDAMCFVFNRDTISQAGRRGLVNPERAAQDPEKDIRRELIDDIAMTQRVHSWLSGIWKTP